MKYTISELKHLRNIMARDFDDSFADDEYDTERGFFLGETEKFFVWLEEMERADKVCELLLSDFGFVMGCECDSPAKVSLPSSPVSDSWPYKLHKKRFTE